MEWNFLSRQRSGIFWAVVIFSLVYTLYGTYTEFRDAENEMNDPHEISADPTTD